MRETPTLRVENVHIQNVRCFEELRCDLHPEATVFFGENGSGKTALIEALSVGLGALFCAMENIKVTLMRAHDRRRVVHEIGGMPGLEKPTPVMIEIGALLDGAPASWRIGVRTRASVKGSAAGQWGKRAERAVGRGAEITLPVVAYYPASRLWHRQGFRDDPDLASRLDAYDGCLSAPESFLDVTTWMRRLAYAARGGNGEAIPASLHQAGLALTVQTGVPEVVSFHYEILSEEVHVKFHDGTTQPFNLLSDGFRITIGLIADLAWRAILLNPHLGADAPRLVDGVVLIDEIDLHLHPSWQRRILGDLRRAFPKVQFIVTTHSPQVLASAKREWVRRISPTGVHAVGHVEGRDSNALLAEVFGDRERPAETEERLVALFQLIDQERMDEAASLLTELERTLGFHDAQLVRARWLLAGLGGA
ncbi:MAG: AAA family ATPase [Pseudomonadota bacterium]